MLKKFSQNMAMSLFFAICALATVIYGTHVFAKNYFAADHSFLQESSSGAVALYILSDTGNAESSTQFEFDANPCMIPVLFTIQTGTLNQTDADHIRCIFSYNGTETESDSVNLWRSIACSDGAIEDNGDQITANSPVLLSDLEYDVQTDGTSMFYAGIVYLQVPVTFDAQSNLTLAVSTIPDQVVLGQSGLALTPYSNGFQNGVTVNGNSSMALFDSYINAWRNTFSFQTSTATTASSGSRSGNPVFDAKIQSYENGTMTYSSSCTVPTNTRFGNVTSANTNVEMAGKLPGYLGGYSNRVVSDSVPRLQISIEIPKATIDSLYDGNEAAEKGYLSFNYSYSAPVEPGGNGTESEPYTAVPPADGHFRIWRTGNQSAGEAASVPVVSGTEIPISNFLYYRPGYPDDVYIASVSLEAVRHSETALPITVTLLNSNHQPVANSSATINVQPVLCGLQIDSNNDSEITMDDEYVEHAMFKNLPLSTAENPVYTPVKLTFAKVYNNILPITLRQKFNVTQPNGVTFYEKTGSGENETYTPVSLQNQTISTFFANSESTNYYARTLYIKADTPVTAGEIAVETSGAVGDVGQVKDEVQFAVFTLQDINLTVKSAVNTTDKILVQSNTELKACISFLPAANDKSPILECRWFCQQMLNSGLFGAWQEIMQYKDKDSLCFKPDAGIYHLKVEVKFQEGYTLTAFLRRQSDDSYSDRKQGDLDCYGVYAEQWQINMLQNAVNNLGSSLWSEGVAKIHSHGSIEKTFAQGKKKCNLFVCEMGHCNNGFYVPLINGLPSKDDPPVANQWAGDTNIENWSKLTMQERPQPGYVWAKQGTNGASGHCGIVDYDGQVISAQASNDQIGRRQNVSVGSTFRKYIPPAPNEN